MDIVSAIASVNALIIAFFLYKRKEQKTSIKILSIWSIAFAIHFSTPFFIERDLFFSGAYWGFIIGIVTTSHTPFLFVYTNSLADKNFKFNFKNLWHFGFILIYILSFIPLFLLGKEKHLELVYEKQGLAYQAFLPLITVLFCQVYFLIRTTIVLIKHQHNIKHEFSYEKKVDLAWIKRIVLGFAVLIVLSFIAYAMVSANIISINTMDYSIIVVNMIIYFYIAYSGYQQKDVYKPEKPDIQKSIVKKNKPVSRKKTQSLTQEKLGVSSSQDPIIEELLDVMEKEKLYLNHELTLGDLANQLNVHANQLSKVINENLHKNFFEFVNEFRIQEFKRLVANPKHKHISILGLAMDAGFNSKASFNRIFKNSTGLTPSEFRESYQF
jgi:AraC-like DNA-binding protein